jgi:hypothetical protein
MCAATTIADKTYLTTWTNSWTVLKSGLMVESEMAGRNRRGEHVFLSKFREDHQIGDGDYVGLQLADSGYLGSSALQGRYQVLLYLALTQLWMVQLGRAEET